MRAATQTPWFTDHDLYLLGEGTHVRVYEKLGAHPGEIDGREGVHFALWAPEAERVSVTGDHNEWSANLDPLQRHADAGLWETFIPGVKSGSMYKYRVLSDGVEREQFDPFAFAAGTTAARTLSRIWDLQDYTWHDSEWMSTRGSLNPGRAPVSIYEVHLGSWRRVPEEGNRRLSYRELAAKLATYVHDAGFTHVEFLPVMEHPFDDSLGYRTGASFAPDGRFGSPSDFMSVVDTLHRRGIGVILDWSPAHFLKVRSNVDPGVRLAQREKRSFLISNALFWADKYHIDGLRIPALDPMLRAAPESNGSGNLDALDIFHSLNDQLRAAYPGVMIIAGESTRWPNVSQSTDRGELAFDLQWNTGWTRDVLEYMSKDPIYRSYHHTQITSGVTTDFSKHFILPFSHLDAAPGNPSMLARMPGDEWQRFGNLRLLYGYCFGHPGKKLLFMGDEFGQWAEWNEDASLDWHLLQFPLHAGLHRWVRDLNTFYRAMPTLHELDADPNGFEWVDSTDAERSVVSFLRKGSETSDATLFVFNFTPVPRHNYRVGVPHIGGWREVLNSDATIYGGSGQGNGGRVTGTPLPIHGRPYSLSLTLPPLAVVVLRPEVPDAR